MTIFPQIPQALLRGESVKDICSLSSQSEHAFNAIDRLRTYQVLGTRPVTTEYSALQGIVGSNVHRVL